MLRFALKFHLSLVVMVLAVTPLAATAGSASAAGETKRTLIEKGPGDKSRAVYVGRDLTADGSVLLGGWGDEPSSHWLEIVPRRQFPDGATTTVGVTDRAEYPGELIEIPQARRTAKYITSNYSEFAGFPAPLTNGGLNEHGVAARDVWSPTIDRLLAMTPNPQRGPNYSDLSRIAMERATSAREAVEIVGSLIDKYGYSDYGGNSHLFADRNEGWVLINYGGGQGLWAAERLGADEVRVSYPGYLNPFPLDYKDHPDEYRASDNFIDFAVQQGWFDPAGETRFDPQEVYAGWRPDTQLDSERELREQLAPVSREDMMAYIRDPRWSRDTSGYGHVAHLRRDLPHPELGVLWTAVTGAVTTPYVPIHLGVQDVPPEFKQHRYMTSQSDDSFLASDYAALEATRYATYTFKRLMYYTCDKPETFLKPVTAEIEAFEQKLLDEQPRLERKALQRYKRGDDVAARGLLTDNAERRLLDKLTLGEDLVRVVEKKTRRRFGVRMPTGRDLPGETYRPESQSMAIDDDFGSLVTCFRDGIDDYPREHSVYSDLAGDLLGRRDGKPSQARSGGIASSATGGVAMFLLGTAAGGLLVLRRRGRNDHA
jgi:dipeptidase